VLSFERAHLPPSGQVGLPAGSFMKGRQPREGASTSQFLITEVTRRRNHCGPSGRALESTEHRMPPWGGGMRWPATREVSGEEMSRCSACYQGLARLYLLPAMAACHARRAFAGTDAAVCAGAEGRGGIFRSSSPGGRSSRRMPMRDGLTMPEIERGSVEMPSWGWTTMRHMGPQAR